MEWKNLLGSAYTDGMTEEEAQEKFNELYMTREDHEKDVKKNKDLIDTYSKQIAENKRKERERLSDEEKKKLEDQEAREEQEKKIKDLERQIGINNLVQSYMERGFDKELAAETATAMYDGDNATVLSNEKIFAGKREAALKSQWEKEYSVNPPAGNGTGKVDYSKEIAAAQEAGDMVAMAAYINKQAAANKDKK